MRIAVDIGFGFVKTMNENGEQVSFPSVIAKRQESSIKNIIGGAVDNYNITLWDEGDGGQKLNERKYYVGDAGMTNGGNRRWEDKSEFNTEDMKIFIATAVALVNPLNEEVDLCVGLPMSYFTQKKEDLKNMLKPLNARIKIEQIKGTRTIKFKSIFVFPQGAGAYYSAICDRNGDIKDINMATSSVGVIDVGYRTVDYLVMAKGRNGITMVEGLSGSLEEDGMNVAFQEIEKAVSSHPDVQREIGLLEIEKAILWFGGKLNFKKLEINLTEIEERAYREHGENIASKIKLKWGNDADSLGTILISGGGGSALFPVFQTKFEQAELQANPEFANCEGYLGAQARRIKQKQQG